MKHLIIVCSLFVTLNVVGQTDTIKTSKHKNSIAITWESFVLDIAGVPADTGAGLVYTRDFWSKGKHNFAFQPSASFVYVPNTEIRYIFGLGALYRFDITKRGSIGLSLAGNFVHTHLNYDRFEYNAQGQFINEGANMNSFVPSIGLQYNYDFLRIKSTSIGVLLAFKLIRFDSGNYVKTFEGNNFNFSFGFYCKF